MLWGWLGLDVLKWKTSHKTEISAYDDYVYMQGVLLSSRLHIFVKSNQTVFFLILLYIRKRETFIKNKNACTLKLSSSIILL